jgi:NarL family two-component system response regulator LiaR
LGGTIRILIVDDHALFAEVLQVALERRRLEVVGRATSGREGVALAHELRPDLVLMDLGLPDIDGLTAGQRILRELPGTKVVAVTGLEDHAMVREALRRGFQGYMLKHASMAELVESVMAMARGQTVIPHDAAKSLAGTPRDESSADLASQLTERERQILALLAEGASSQELANRLYLSRNTVRSHVQNICGKLQVHSRLQAVAFAVKHGIMYPEVSHPRG